MNRRKKLLYRSAATLPFRPTDLSGLLAWWDSTDVSTLFTGSYADRLTATTNPTTPFDPLCRHEDKSGSGNHLTCVADATRPTYDTTSLLNGHACALLGTWSRPAFTGTAKTWFQVFRHTGSTVDTRLNTNGQSLVSLGISSATSWRLSFVRDNVAWIDSGFSQGTTNRIYRTEYVVGGNSSFWTASAGVETLRQSTALVGSGSVASALINMPGQLYETIVYNRTLTAPEVTSVHAYLTAKYGI